MLIADGGMGFNRRKQFWGGRSMTAWAQVAPTRDVKAD